jgi:hypothetical protein
VGSAHVPENPERVYRRGLPASPVRAYRKPLLKELVFGSSLFLKGL